VFETIGRPLLGCNNHALSPELAELEKLTEFVAAERNLLYKFFPPRRLHHFMEVERQIGAGGFGIVFQARATHRGLQRIPALEEGCTYAVKRASLTEPEPIDLSIMRLSKERLLEFIDAMTSKACHEAHIVRHIAFLQEVPRYWYEVMELLEGPDLSEYLTIRTRTVGEAASAQLTKQIFTAIHYLHRQVGMLHRDIKPDNFAFVQPLRSETELPPLKLFDFGISWAIENVVTEETARTLIEVKLAGTAQYCAPEGWRGKCGPSLDVWGAGIIVYCMLSLEMPYGISGCRKRGKLAVQNNPLEFDVDRWANVSPLAQELVASMLDKDVERRATTTEVLQSNWLANPGDGLPLQRDATMPTPAKSGSRWKSLLFPQTTGAMEALSPGSDHEEGSKEQIAA